MVPQTRVRSNHGECIFRFQWRQMLQRWHVQTIVIVYSGMFYRKSCIRRAFAVLMSLGLLQAARAAENLSSAAFDPGEAFRTHQQRVETGDPRPDLERAIQAAKDPLEEARARLELANWWAAVSMTGPATRWLLGMQNQADLQDIAEAAREAGSQLGNARDLLDAAGATSRPESRDDQSSEDRRQALIQAADTLAGFVEIFEQAESKISLANGDPDRTRRNRWRTAGRRLAIARESEDPQLAAAALLWQSFAFEQGGRRDRALEALPNALVKPEHLPYSLMCRIVRCRMLAEDGRNSAAMVLLSRMEPLLKEWISRQTQDRHQVRRLIGLVQYRVAQQWLKGLELPARSAVAEQLRPILDKVEGNFTEVKNPEVYVMPTTIPPHIIPSRPVMEAEPDSPGTQPELSNEEGR